MKTAFLNIYEYRDLLREGRYIVHHVSLITYSPVPGLQKTGYVVAYTTIT